MSQSLKVVFMGTPEFAATTLKSIAASQHKVLAVVTVPDKPAGRGQKLTESEVKAEATRLGIPVLQPAKLKAPEFISELKQLGADVFIVVAFRMLPKEVWAMPPHGTFNLHASLLPHYRGAAPINWAIINGDKTSGNTTFFINEEIDTGKIIYQEELPIGPNELAGELHDRLMISGAALVVKTLDAIADGSVEPVEQPHTLNGEPLKQAPKIFKDTCKIKWSESCEKVLNHIRGLSPYPAAWSTLRNATTSEEIPAKIFKVSISDKKSHSAPGTIATDGKTYIHVATGEGTLSVEELQLAGKKRLATAEFLRGFKDLEHYWFT